MSHLEGFPRSELWKFHDVTDFSPIYYAFTLQSETILYVFSFLPTYSGEIMLSVLKLHLQGCFQYVSEL